jgi:DedD protein
VEERIKQRLVGAVVLVSLVVIFVPMFLEDEPVLDRGIKGTNVPPQPRDLDKFRSGVLPAPLALPGPSAAPGSTAAAPGPKPVSVTAEARTPPEANPTPKPGPTSAVPPSESLTAVRPASSAQGSESREAPKGVSNPNPRPTAPPKPRVGVSAWVVQLGSFAQHENADRLAERLRKKHQEAFVEQVEIAGKLWFRVRVGPELDRKRADEMLSAVRRILRTEGEGAHVVRYP